MCVEGRVCGSLGKVQERWIVGEAGSVCKASYVRGVLFGGQRSLARSSWGKGEGVREREKEETGDIGD